MALIVAMAQLNTVVGDVDGNVRRVLEQAARARDELGAGLVVFPELTISGYPPEDLLFHGNMRRSVDRALATLAAEITGITAVVGYPEYDGDDLYNAAAVIRDGAIAARYRKQLLPNYGVFDEKRYFESGDEPLVFEVDGVRCGLTICEDVWGPGPARQCQAAGAELILIINGSPFDVDHLSRREAVLRDRARETGLPLLYCNMVGGQDELVFDGGSTVVGADGAVTQRAPLFEESLSPVAFRRDPAGRIEPVPAAVTPAPALAERVYRALVLGTRDYVDKHRFPGVVLGLSGGIDSALTLAVAVDALGAERVRTVMMPSRYTASISLEDAAEMARRIGVRYDVVSIEPMFDTIRQGLAELFEGRPEDVTEENIQSRCRGIILMAISNKLGLMLLTTGNKSEMAVGYATLYGDMAGGFAPIKDCSKSLVFALARYRNSVSEVIPERIITRPPSAELRADQKDTDSLPPYDVLDPILEAFIEEDCSVDEIVARGYDRAVVGRILGLVKLNEYKRRQAPPGIRISRRAFGRDWRYPITSGFDAG
jgi:NAD+ synthase (glutamine-hydrolysing)